MGIDIHTHDAPLISVHTHSQINAYTHSQKHTQKRIHTQLQPPFTIRLPHGHPHPSPSQQFTYKKLQLLGDCKQTHIHTLNYMYTHTEKNIHAHTQLHTQTHICTTKMDISICSKNICLYCMCTRLTCG